jgi:ABC-type transport system involved in cytochrome bd biosynthesis fused ATPase/permease subunit
MARLNRENSLIENNLYPLAGLHPDAVEDKFAEILAPFEQDILNVESALLLHNIPLLGVFAGFLVSFLILSILLTKHAISPLVYAIILVPVLDLVYLLGGVDFGRTLYKPLPQLPPDDPSRVRTLKELLHWFAPTLKWGWRVAFYVYRTFVCPNAFDAIIVILATIFLGLLGKVVNLLVIILVLLVLALVVPAILTKTPAGQFVKQLGDESRKKAEAPPVESEKVVETPVVESEKVSETTEGGN